MSGCPNAAVKPEIHQLIVLFEKKKGEINQYHYSFMLKYTIENISYITK